MKSGRGGTYPVSVSHPSPHQAALSPFALRIVQIDHSTDSMIQGHARLKVRDHTLVE